MCYGENVFVFRQSFVLFTICLQSVSNGVMLALPSVLNTAILEPDSDIKATPSQASWLAFVVGLAGMAGFLFLSPMMQIYGRKPVHITKNILMAAGWIIFYFSDSLASLFAARIVQGLSMGGIFFNMIMIGEYVNPNRRGYFTTIQKLAVSSGALMCHLMAVWCSWRQIVVATLGMPIVSIILTLFWKESPFYLAMRGRFEECEQSFHWLNGTLSRNTELEELISNQKISRTQKRLESHNRFQRLLKQLLGRDFRKSLLIAAISIVTVDLCGRNYFKAYAVQIMMELFKGKSTAIYISVGADIFVLVALIISCFAVRCLNRRVLLFSLGAVTVACLLSVSVILHLKSHNVLYPWPWLVPSLIIFVNFIVHIGVSPVCYVIVGEIIPLELKGIGCFLIGIVYTGSYGTFLKLTPVFIESLGLGGMYFIYASGIFVCLLSLYFILPETKDKSLLDIEDNLKGISNNEVTHALLKEST